MRTRIALPSLLFVFFAITAGKSDAQEAPLLHLHKPTLTCESGESHVELNWDSLDSGKFTIERIYSWREGWETLETEYTSQTYVDHPSYIHPRTYVYQVSAILEGKRIISNRVRVDVSSCFPQITKSQIPFVDPKVAFPKMIPQNLWGANVGYLADDGSAFEELVGKTMSAQSATVYWGNENDFPIHLAEAFADKVMVLFWNPGDYTSENVDDPRFSYDSIISGTWDEYIASFANQIASYNNPVILVPFRDMNGNWFPWGGTVNTNSAEKHIAAYRHIHTFFNDIDNVYFGWSVSNQSVPDIGTNSIVGYYPGSTYVDVVGVSGYNYGEPWQTFHDVFAPTLFDFKIFQKPVMIFGMASTEGKQKSSWIIEAITLQIPQYAEIIGWLWDNVSYDERYNWRVDSSAESLEAFRKALKH